MANKIIKHYYNEDKYPTSSSPPEILEPDKTKSISELSRKELWEMLSRLRDETEMQNVIRQLKRNSGEQDSFEKPFEIDTKTPINQMYHAGIKGQKWGVRRFQNEDGTRTSAGKKRDGDDRSKTKSEDHQSSRTSKAKGLSGLSNDELKKLNERLQLEETYSKLSAAQMAKSKSWVNEAIRTSGKTAVTAFATGVFLGSAKLLVKEISPQFAEAAFGIKQDKAPVVPTLLPKKQS